MARPAKGSITWRKNPKTGALHWHVRITLGDGSRPFVPLDPAIAHADVAAAQRCAELVSDEARAMGAIPDDVRETVGEWFKRFHAAKEARGFSSVKEMRGRAKNWILPGIEDKPMASVTSDDIKAIVKRLDRAIMAYEKRGREQGTLSPSTAANVWGDLVHAFHEACTAKDESLQAIRVNPAADVRGPETGDDREGPILYSDEIALLLTGTAADREEDDVPLYRRRCYAMALYTAARRGELAALTVRDVDLENGRISITKQVDRKGKKGATKKTKTKRSREIDIDPNVAPLVALLVREAGGKSRPSERLLRVPPAEDCAELLRKDLWTVGVRREALHTEDTTRTKMWFHHLRDTCLTHMAVRKDSPVIIQWTAGHTDYKMTQSYVQRGQTEARRIGVPLPPLPSPVLDPTPGKGKKARPSSATDSATIRNSSPNLPESPHYFATPTGIEGNHETAPIAFDLAEFAIEDVAAGSETASTSSPLRGEPEPLASPQDVDEADRRTRALAAAAGQWDLVAELTEEIRARTLARAGNVVDIAVRKRSR